jgi:hypothetical protein
MVRAMRVREKKSPKDRETESQGVRETERYEIWKIKDEE